ncbi:hypothetical protein NUTIK01_05130 [Novosphingobium sp. IK01]|uniref:Uncharacterized protein n=1 Tax=Novosphingobium pituita TaxID=3056842 RepID=A0ABQ6P3H5_9SPHN|nr:hypothetical protein NUTIK01_05130 [Novosphingobium sp. IK01]
MGGIEPAVVGAADTGKGTQFDHDLSPDAVCKGWVRASSAAVGANLGIPACKEMAMMENHR